MPYIGNQGIGSYTSMSKQTITGNGGVNYTLSSAVANSFELAVFVNNVRQEPTTAYGASGTALTMTGAVASSDNFYVVYIGKAIGTINPPDGSVGKAQLAAGANVVSTDVQNTFTKSQLASTYTGSGLTLDLDTYQNFIITLAAGSNALANPSTEASQVGQTGVIVFIQPSTGSAGTVSLATDWETAESAGLTLSSANNDYDVVPYLVKADNSILLGAPQLNFG